MNVTNEVLEYFNLIDACGLGKRVTSLEELGLKVSEGTWRDVETTWCEMLGEELGGDIIQLQGIGELEDIWGLKRGDVLNVMIQSELSEEETI